jgi:alpha-glucosidase
VIRRGLGPEGAEPPTDWHSFFGGPAWEPLGDGDWYLHLFAPEQPDLNWANPEVRDDFLTTLRFWSDRGVDGFRIDVAHLLVKDHNVITGVDGSLPTQAELSSEQFADGHHPFADRDDVHDIYKAWRELFDEYDPPRMAVAEAWVPAHRRVRFASSEGLGQAFNFDLLQTEWDATAFRKVIDDNLALAREAGASSTWVLSNHDMVRHATRYALPNGTDLVAWLHDGATDPAADLSRGLRRARAATLLALALPGSAYLYQGEELGLPEVTDLPDDVRQDPTFVRSGGAEKGRDGARVPLPWRSSGSSFGFGPAGSHLPQPEWFVQYSVEAESADLSSTLRFYVDALAARRSLFAEEELTWLDSLVDVVSFERPGGWVNVTNFSTSPVPLPPGRVVISSRPITGADLPGETTVWLVDEDA